MSTSAERLALGKSSRANSRMRACPKANAYLYLTLVQYLSRVVILYIRSLCLICWAFDVPLNFSFENFNMKCSFQNFNMKLSFQILNREFSFQNFMLTFSFQNFNMELSFQNFMLEFSLPHFMLKFPFQNFMLKVPFELSL